MGLDVSSADVALTSILGTNIPSGGITSVPSPDLSLWKALILGLVQGLTEFLPISSTAHLKAIPVALGWGDPGVAFIAVIQLGSIAAILWYFWADLTQVTRGSLKAIARSDYESTDFRIGMGIILGTLPIVIFGLLVKLFYEEYDNSPIRSMSAIAFTSIGLAILLGLAEKVGLRKRDLNTLSISDGIGIGFAQALAIIPGVSRSGSTLTAALFLGLERAAAARFSFLLGIPSITLAGLVELKDLIEVGMGGAGLGPLIAGLLAATISSYAAIAWLLRYLQNHNVWVFVWYRLAFGLAILAGVVGGVFQNI